MSPHWRVASGVLACLCFLRTPTLGNADQRFLRLLQRHEDLAVLRRPPKGTAAVADTVAGNEIHYGVASSLLAAAREPSDGSHHLRVPVETGYDRIDNIDVTWEAIFASLWVAIVAGGPVLIMRMNRMDEGITLTRAWFSTRGAQALLTAGLLVGGIIAFTQTIVFESAHFEGKRSLTIVESVYLLSQIITTVGYGDITPAYQRGQVVVAFYVLVCLFLIADVVSQISDAILKRVQDYAKKASVVASVAFRVAARRSSPRQADVGNSGKDDPKPEAKEDTSDDGEDDNDDDDDDKDVGKLFVSPEVDWTPLISSSTSFVFFFVIGVLFYHLYPGEDKTWFQATYMSIITLSTTGFGAFTATTQWGKVFGAFWMLFGVAALCCFVSAFTEIMAQLKELDKFRSGAWKRKMKAGFEALEKGPQMDLDRTDFLCFAAMQLEYIDEDTLLSIDRTFLRMNPDKDGTISIDSIPMPKATGAATPKSGSGTSTPRSKGKHAMSTSKASLPAVDLRD